MDRHPVEIEDVDREDRNTSEEIEEHLGRVEAHPRRMNSVLDAALWLAGLRSAVDPTANKVETWEAFVLVMQASSAIFKVAGTTEGMVEVQVGQRMLSLPAGSTGGYADAGNWVTAFYFAVMCRDQERLTMLSKVPLELLRATGAEFDGYIYAWVDTLQTYWLEGDGLGDKLRAALKGAEPASARFAPPELMLQILYPPINLFYRFFTEEVPAFNGALAQALELHDRYWNSDEGDRRSSRVGLLSPASLAMACLAFDAGLPIEVESDYLPPHILKRSWLGEFPT